MLITDVLKMAMEHEKDAADRYRDYASKADDTDSRILFEQLAREEDNHFRLLQTRLNAYKLLNS